MKIADPTGIKAAAHFGCDRRSHQLACGGMVVESVEQMGHPCRNGRSGHVGHARYRRKIGYRHDPGHYFSVNSRRCNRVAETEKGFGLEKELGDRTAGACIQLPLQKVDVGHSRSCFGVRFRIRAYRDFEWMDFLEPFNKFCCAGIAVRVWRKLTVCRR